MAIKQSDGEWSNKEYMQNWRKRNIEKCKKYCREYHKRNKKKKNAYNKKWREEHPAYHREYYHRVLKIKK